MTIFHFCSYYEDNSFYTQLFLELKNLGVKRQIVFVPTYNSGQYDKIENEYGTLIRIGLYKKHERLLFIKRVKKAVLYIKDFLAEENIDFIHAHTWYSNGYISYLIKKELKKKYSISVRNTDLNIFYRYFPWLRKIGMEILSEAEKIVFISPNYKDWLLAKNTKKRWNEWINLKSIIIPNGVDLYWINNINMPKRLYGDKIRLIFVGKVDRNKNIIEIIRYVRKHKNTSLTIVGNGKLYLKYKRRFEFERICFFGFINDKDKLKALYRDSDIFVMNSRKETFGIVYLEAMSQGLPVIYTKKQGFDSFFAEGEVGYSKEVNDGTLGNKIKKIIDRYELISKNCIKHVVQFNWSEIAHSYVNIYKENRII